MPGGGSHVCTGTIAVAYPPPGFPDGPAPTAERDKSEHVILLAQTFQWLPRSKRVLNDGFGLLLSLAFPPPCPAAPPTAPRRTLQRPHLPSAALILTASALHPGQGRHSTERRKEERPHAGDAQGPVRPLPTSPHCLFTAWEVLLLLLPLKLHRCGN